MLDSITITDASGKTITLTRAGNNKFTFTMPSGRVKVNANYKPLTKFADVDDAPNNWYKDAVHYVVAYGLMNGTNSTAGAETFEPQTTTTRSMVVTILYRLEGEPETATSNFSDVASGQWYTNGVNWAAANGIVKGYGDNNFGPNDIVTREQLATILYRYVQFKKWGSASKTTDLTSYTDAGDINSWAQEAMKWSNAAGIITGTTSNTLTPAGQATRAELATMLMRFCENVAE